MTAASPTADPPPDKSGPASSSYRTLVEILALAAAYALLGWGGLMLAVPPGYATPLWPAAGLAVGILLLRGMHLFPGVWLGSFLINMIVGNAVAADGIDWTAMGVAMGIAGGSTLQALVASALLNWRFHRPIKLNGLADLVIFALLSGPVSCLVAATVGVGNLYLAGYVGSEDIADNWITWYSGDITGIAIFLPLVILSGWSRWEMMWKRHALPRLSAFMLVSLGALIVGTLIAWRITSIATYERNSESFVALAEDSRQALEHRLDTYAQSLHAGAALLGASKGMTTDEWNEYVERLRIDQTLPGINGLGFIEAWERGDIADRQAQRTARGLQPIAIHPDTGRDELFVISTIEPMERNAAALGLDIAFEQNRRDAANTARTTGESTITKRIFLVQDEDQTPGFLLLRPLYGENMDVSTPAARKTAFRGWVYAPFIAQRFMQNLTRSQGTTLNISVYDGPEVDENRLIYSSAKDGGDGASHSYSVTRTIPVYGEQWTVRWTSTPLFATSVASHEASLVLAGGMFISLLFAILLTSYSRKQSSISQQVEEKTRELVEREQVLQEAVHALGESEKRFSALAGLSPVGIFRTDQYGFCTFVNDAWLKTTGLPIHASMGAGWLTAVHPEDRDKVHQGWLKAIDREERLRMEFRFRTDDETVKWVELLSAPEIDDNDEVLSFIGVVIDNTDRKLAELAVAERDTQLAFFAENITDGIAYFDMRDGTLEISDRLAKMFGLPSTEITREQMVELVHPDDRYFADDLKRMFMEQGDSQIMLDQRLRNVETGEYISVETIAKMVRDDKDGTPRGFIFSLRDISERKELQNEIAKALERAEAATKAKSAFLANMSHDIRTPMNGVLGFAELMLADDPSPLHRRYLEMILQSSRAMMALLNDILDISKIEAGGMRIHKQPVAIRQELGHWIEALRPVAMGKDLPFSIDILSSVPQMMNTDALRLRQIVTNLVGNAIKFTDTGKVAVRAQLSNNDLVIDVKDTGIGIDADQQDTIFDQFVQEDSSMARRHGGTGLGLAISRELAGLLGGDLILRSVKGKGTLLRLRIPFEAAEAVEPPAREQSQASLDMRIGDGTRTILVAEDNDINQELIEGMLTKLGYRTEIAADGAQAVEMVESARQAGRPYPLILMDLQMPVMNGRAATRAIRALGIDGTQLPIVALSANAYQEDKDASLAAGMQDHLAKPVRMRDLSAALTAWLPPAEAESTQMRPDDTNVARLRQPSEADNGTPPTSKGGARTRLADKFAARKADLGTRFSDALSSREMTDEAWETLIGSIHQLAGTAGLFGEAELGEAMRELEVRLKNGPADRRLDELRQALDDWKEQLFPAPVQKNASSDR